MTDFQDNTKSLISESTEIVITTREEGIGITEDTMTLMDAVCIRNTMFGILDKNQPGSSELLKLAFRKINELGKK